MATDEQKFELVVTDGVNPSVVIDRLHPYFALNLKSGSFMMLRCAAEPGSLPQFIQLVASAALWAPLALPAAAFLKRLAEKAADATWDGIKNFFSSTDVKADEFVNLVSTLSGARAGMGERCAIVIGLNFPHSYWGTVATITSEDINEQAKAIAKFIVNAQDISELVHEEVSSGHKPLGHVKLKFVDNGVEIYWIDQDGFKLNERHLKNG